MTNSFKITLDAMRFVLEKNTLYIMRQDNYRGSSMQNGDLLAQNSLYQ